MDDDKLSDYAMGHLLILAISKRFERVVARHPKRLSAAMRFRITMAREEGRRQADSYPMLLKSFDYFIHGKIFP